MAFIRFKKAKGNGCSYAYLVHNKRVRGKVKQKVLCYIGKLHEINKETILELEQRHPRINVDWEKILARIQRKARKKRDKANPLMSDIDIFRKNIKRIREAKKLDRSDVAELLCKLNKNYRFVVAHNKLVYLEELGEGKVVYPSFLKDLFSAFASM